MFFIHSNLALSTSSSEYPSAHSADIIIATHFKWVVVHTLGCCIIKKNPNNIASNTNSSDEPSAHSAYAVIIT